MPLPDDSAARPGGTPPQPRGAEGARPDTPEPAGTRKPVDAPAQPATDGEPARPPIPEDAPDTGRPPQPAGAKPSGPTPAGAKPAGPPPGGPKRPPVRKPARPPGAKRPAVPPTARTVDPEGDGAALGLPVLSRKDFVSGSDVRWCPGCGDYAVLAAVQRALPDLAETRENVVFISGIGCSSRFPYYMNTYGFHSIHGRAPAVATGLKSTRPELDVWVVTGDGDALSIGAGHTAHMLRRNVDLQVLLFNNQIYGLTKGQYSPTSEVGKVTKSSPYGSLDHPFNPAALALGSDGSFVARTLDRDPKHMQAVLKAGHAHRGTSFIEIYQNCNIFNDGAFFEFTERDTKALRTVMVEDGQPMTFANGTKGLVLDGLTLRAVDLDGDRTADDCLVYDSTDKGLALLVADQTFWSADLPRPFGVLYQEDRPTYDAMLNAQVEEVRQRKGPGQLAELLASGDTWTIE
ncbi:thiamine pyrophosphate-dependent enzyme [Rubrivirga sp. IMCC45206]|uniref:2-oxoacid:ferredoxin oxidoreductase subunit beta n=1 Tax=Rubrivirga sp. IMCC45206 TaxID=3391614 RepID=UPI00398FB11F